MLSPNEDIVLWGCTNASQWTEHSADNDDHHDDYGDNDDFEDNGDYEIMMMMMIMMMCEDGDDVDNAKVTGTDANN